MPKEIMIELIYDPYLDMQRDLDNFDTFAGVLMEYIHNDSCSNESTKDLLVGKLVEMREHFKHMTYMAAKGVELSKNKIEEYENQENEEGNI